MGIYRDVKIFNENDLSEKKKNQIYELNKSKKDYMDMHPEI